MPATEPTKYVTTFAEYTRGKPLGEGGSGFVFEVTDPKGERYAVKILKPQGVTQDRRKRFKNEVLFCQRTSHPNIVPILDHGVRNENGIALPFYVMPLYGRSLRQLIEAGLQPDTVLPLFSQILDGVEAAHLQGVIHRDLKPENILIHGDHPTPVIADFGIAQFQQDDLYTAVETRASDRLANFKYAAPEQRERGNPVDATADTYALGLILNELFTRRIPLGTGYVTISSISPQYAYLDVLVAQMIRQLPSERPPTLATVKHELIARGNAFVSEQRLSSLKDAVIPSSEIDDPLVLHPVTIADFEWGENTLVLVLSQPVNEKWVSALLNMGSHTSAMGKGLEAFTFRGNKASISAREGDVQRMIDYFKQWLPLATRKYEQMLRADLQRAEQKRAADHQARIQEEEARQRVRRDVKI